MKNRIVDEMLKKAAEAEKAGDKERADHWFERAAKAEEIIERIRNRNAS